MSVVLEIRGRCTRALDVPSSVKRQMTEYIRDLDTIVCCLLRIIRSGFSGDFSSKVLDQAIELAGEIAWEIALKHFDSPLREQSKPPFPVLVEFTVQDYRVLVLYDVNEPGFKVIVEPRSK